MNRPITTLAGLTILLGPALPGCAGFGHLPEQSQTVIDGPLWDAEGAVATADGLYVALPYSGGVALLQPDNKSKPHRTVELGPGRVSGIAAAPGSDTIIASVSS